MDFLIGLFVFFVLAYLISGAVQFATRKSLKCCCGFECYSEEEMMAHVLSQNSHKLVE